MCCQEKLFHNGSTYDIEYLLSESKDYYKAIKTNSAFNGNYIEYKSKEDNGKNLAPKEYPDMIKPYLSNTINDHKKRKIQLTMRINFIFSKDLRETSTMHTKSDKTKIMMSSETNDILEELCKSLQKDQERFRRINERKQVCFW